MEKINLYKWIYPTAVKSPHTAQKTAVVSEEINISDLYDAPVSVQKRGENSSIRSERSLSCGGRLRAYFSPPGFAQTVVSFSLGVFTCSLWCFSLTFTWSSLAAFWQEAAGGCQCHARLWPLSVQAHHRARTGKVKASWQQRFIIIITSDKCKGSTFLLNESFCSGLMHVSNSLSTVLSPFFSHITICSAAHSPAVSVSAPTFSKPPPPRSPVFCSLLDEKPFWRLIGE